jgi:hypothetical protein
MGRVDYFEGYDDDDIKALSEIYLSILTEMECKFIVESFQLMKSVYISGTGPFAEFYFYSFEKLLGDEMKDYFMRIQNEGLYYHKITILVARRLIEKRDSKKMNTKNTGNGSSL